MMDIADIDSDFERFCKQHSYYKHCSPHGELVYLDLRKGEQPRNSICDDVDDSDTMHWWFLSEPPEEGLILPIKINCFTRGLEEDSDTFGFGFNTIMYLWEDAELYIRKKYPNVNIRDPDQINIVFRNENLEQLNAARLAACEYLEKADFDVYE